MEGVGSRLGRASSRYGPAPVFTGPVRKWKKQWVQVSSPPSSYSRSNKHNNDAPSLRLCKWTPISSTNSSDNSGQPEEPPRRKFRYTPIVVLDEMKKVVGKRAKHEPVSSKTFQSSPKEATKSDIFRKQDIDSLFVDQFKTMDSEIEHVEVRVKSFLDQLQVEYGIFDRMLYKNKNQHRRCSYFRYLLKVRSDLRLLQSARFEDILSSSFLVIHGKRAKQKVQLLESLKRRKTDGKKHNFLERLLGVARLLSQIVEPMLKAARAISTLLARSFFMGFSLTIMALLARLRVLVQQVLLDVVAVFNAVSSLSRKEQSVKLTHNGFEVFRDLYPTNERVICLECVWQTDKFVLVERMCEPASKNQDMDVEEDVSLGAPGIQYESMETLLGEDEPVKVDPSLVSEQGPSKIGEDNPSSLEGPANKTDVSKLAKYDTKVEGDVHTYPSPRSNPTKVKSGSRNKVAFISVKKPAPSTAAADKTEIPVTDTTSDKDPFFSLLTSGNLKDNLS